jgi:hypothetical protein
LAGSFVAELAAHTGLSWVLDALAIAAWWLTRALRR